MSGGWQLYVISLPAWLCALGWGSKDSRMITYMTFPLWILQEDDDMKNGPK